MVKCKPGCTCKRHTNSGNPFGNSKGPRWGSDPCPKDCTCGKHKREDHHLWTGDQATYVARHKRLCKIRGSAKDLLCIDCGDNARDWSQVHDTDGLNVYADYEPRCRSCHVKYDAELHPRDRLGQFQ